ncbi:MAG: YqhA family protein [Muribaculaceae bacterium]|nr:YqhA family protein [Muribaculaceae bacterium]
MNQLDEFKDIIIKEGHITEEQVVQLQTLLAADSRMNMAKGNLLFEIKEHVAKNKAPASFKKLFINTISKYLLEDESSPGRIDPEEARWLRARIQYEGSYDAYDRALVENLRKKSINFPKILAQKSRQSRIFENILYSARYLSIFAVIGSLVSAIALFLRGGMVVFESIRNFIIQLSRNEVGNDYEKMFEELVSSVDIFLFALVLVIFAVGVYELFITKIDPVERENDTRPSWLRISSVDDLKSSLGKVILMVLIVSFFKHTLELTKDMWEPITLLYLSIGILLIAGALYLTHKSTEHNKDESEAADEDSMSNQ